MDALITNFVKDATILREYFDVIWAIDHHRKHYPSNVMVEVCSCIAHAAVGEDARAFASLERALEHGRHVHEIDKIARDILGQRFRPQTETAEGLMKAIDNAVSARSARKVGPRRGN